MFVSPVELFVVLAVLAFEWIAAIWVWRDARALGADPLPWMLLILLTHLLGLLAYLGWRSFRRAPHHRDR